MVNSVVVHVDEVVGGVYLSVFSGLTHRHVPVMLCIMMVVYVSDVCHDNTPNTSNFLDSALCSLSVSRGHVCHGCDARSLEHGLVVPEVGHDEMCCCPSVNAGAERFHDFMDVIAAKVAESGSVDKAFM